MKNTLKAFQEKIKNIENDILIRRTENNKINSEIKKLNDKNIVLFDEVDNGLKAIELIEKIASYERNAIKYKIEKIITDALRIIYGDGHSVEITYSVKRNRTSVDIEFVKKTNDGDVKRGMDGFGGGVADTISFPLKLLILLASNVSDRIFIADEPGKHIDAKRIEKFGEFLRLLSEKLGLQLIICTHHEGLKDYADSVFEVDIPDELKNVSVVANIKTNNNILQTTNNIIKRLKVRNYESHKDSEVFFTGGVNIFVGDSNKGKSSLIRAIAAICYNKFDNESIRHGAKECTIELETTKGIVKLTKGGKLNDYYIEDFRDGKKYQFDSVNKTVPEIVYDITGMRPLVIGDIYDIPNILFQLDKHYMLSEVNGEDCNSNMIARIIDNVVGLGGIEELINEISSGVLKNKKQATANMNMITDMKTSLHNENDIQCMEANFKNFSKQYEDLNDMVNLNELLTAFKNNYDAVVKKIDDFNTGIDFKIDVELLNAELKELNNLHVKWKNMVGLQELYLTKKNLLNDLNDTINGLPDVNILNALYTDLCNLINKQAALEELSDEICGFKLKIECNKSSLINYTEKQLELENELKELKIKNPVCPLCDKPF